MPLPLWAQLKNAIDANDLAAAEAVLYEHPEVLDEPHRPPLLLSARTVEAAQWLLDHGATAEAAGQAWAGGAGTHPVPPNVARFLIERGAQLTAHAAAGLGLRDELAAMLAADPKLIDAKGMDACTPLHFARDVEIAELLLDYEARIDARDEDHDSTPAQWLIGDAPEVARFLLERGAQPDIFLAAALGDLALTAHLIETDPGCVTCRIGKLPSYPPLGHDGAGGTVYQWTLGFNSYPHQIALKKGHPEVFDLLYAHTDPETRLLVNCVLARHAEAEALAAAQPGFLDRLPPEDLMLPALYCWETNLNIDAVRLMLDLGFPIDQVESIHGYSALHNAAWAGAGDLVDLLITRGHPVNLVDPQYNATPLGYALHDCLVEKRHPEGEFGRVVSSLLAAGATWDVLTYPTRDEAVDAALYPYLLTRLDGAALLGDPAAVERLLPGEPDRIPRALAAAARGGHVEICRHLVAAGAAVNQPTGPAGSTPLMYAALSGSAETVGLLLALGADPAVTNSEGQMARYYARDPAVIDLLAS